MKLMLTGKLRERKLITTYKMWVNMHRNREEKIYCYKRCFGCKNTFSLEELRFSKNFMPLCPKYGRRMRLHPHNKTRVNAWEKRLRLELGKQWQEKLRAANLPLPSLYFGT